MVWIAFALAGLATLLALGTLAWQTPWVGMFGSVGGHVPGWLVVIAGLGLVAGAVSWTMHPSPAPVVAMVASAGAAVTGVMIISDQRRTLTTLGISARFRDFFGPHSPASMAGPDAVVTYGPVEGFTPNMGVFLPEPGDGPAPVVVHIHGGGWSDGTESSDVIMVRHLTRAGYLVLTPTYTHTQEQLPTWELAPRQIARALVDAKALSGSYGGDPNRFFLTGSSAGGHLASLVANRLAKGETFGQEPDALPHISAMALTIPAVDPSFAEGNTYVPAGRTARRLAYAFAGGSPAEVPERYAAIDATSHLSGQSPPALLVHGPNDWLVQSQAINQYALRARLLGVETRTVSIPWTGHLMGLNGAAGRAIVELTLAWFRSHDPSGIDG